MQYLNIPRIIGMTLCLLLPLRIQAASGRVEIEQLGSYESVDAYLRNMDEQEPVRLKQLQTAGVLAFTPVTIPWGRDLHGGNVHFGWPVSVASADGKYICVFFQRKPWH